MHFLASFRYRCGEKFERQEESLLVRVEVRKVMLGMAACREKM
jgi:hypothetical protein